MPFAQVAASGGGYKRQADGGGYKRQADAPATAKDKKGNFSKDQLTCHKYGKGAFSATARTAVD